MKPSEVSLAIDVCLAANDPFLIHGSFGIGKSDIVRQAAARHGLELIDLRLSQFDSVDLRGTPKVINGRTHWCAPADFPGEDAPPTLLFFDEITSAPREVQAAAYQIILDRRIGQFELPDNCRIGAAGNRLNDMGIVHKMAAPLKNRFTHFEMETDLNDWTDWFIKNDGHDDVLAFIRYRPSLLDETVAQNNSAQEQERIKSVFASHGIAKPRSWARISKKIKLGIPPEIELKTYEGDVGEVAATEFLAFRRLAKDMPHPDMVLMNPATAPVPQNPAVLYAISTALARRASSDNFERITIYGDRMPIEFATMMVKDAIRIDPKIPNNPAFTKWAFKHQEVLV